MQSLLLSTEASRNRPGRREREEEQKQYPPNKATVYPAIPQGTANENQTS